MTENTKDQRDAAPTGEGEREDPALRIRAGKDFIEDLLTIKDLRQEIGRELGMRRHLYPKWIGSKRLYPAQAGHQLRCLEALYGYLKALEKIGDEPHPATKEACHDLTASALRDALRIPVPKI